MDDGTAEDDQNDEDENAEIIPSVPALKNENPEDKEICPVCREHFTQEFKHDDGHEDIDEHDAGQWHLVNAIRPDGPEGEAYHPQCYSDKGIYLFTKQILTSCRIFSPFSFCTNMIKL